MTQITSILTGTDFSLDGNNAVRRAALLAREHGAELRVLHVVKPAGCKPLREWFSPTIDIELKAGQARAALRGVASQIHSAFDVTAHVEVVVGDPFATFMQRAQQADWVVLGQRGHSRLGALLIGRTADRMVRTCPRPVLVVKKAALTAYQQVLVPVDFTPSSDAALRLAALAGSSGAVQVFHARDTHLESVLRRSDVAASTIETVRTRAEHATRTRLHRAAARLGLDRRRLTFSIGVAPAEMATLQRARSLDADLIVAGKHGQSTLAGFLLGNVSRRILAGSDCDTLIVPMPRECPRPRVVSAQSAASRAAAGPGPASSASDSMSQALVADATPWTQRTPRFLQRQT